MTISLDPQHLNFIEIVSAIIEVVTLAEMAHSQRLNSNWFLEILWHLAAMAELNQHSDSSKNLYPHLSPSLIRNHPRNLRHPYPHHQTPRSRIDSCHTHLCLLLAQLTDLPPNSRPPIFVLPRQLMHLSSSQAYLRTAARSTSSSSLLDRSSGPIFAVPPSSVVLCLLATHPCPGVSSTCLSHPPLTLQTIT